MPWQQQVVPNGDIVNVAGVFWVNYGSGPGVLFPTLALTLVGPSTYLVTSNYPQTTLTRTVVIQGRVGSGPWFPMWQGNEADLPTTINLLGLEWDEARAVYVIGECEYPSGISTIQPPRGECGLVGADAEVEDDCEAQTFTIEVFTNPGVGYPLGPVTYILNGATTIGGGTWQAGLNTIGPFVAGDVVRPVITNAHDPACNLTLDEYTSSCVVCTVPEVTTTPNVNCEGGDFFIEINVQALNGFVLGDIAWSIDGGSESTQGAVTGIQGIGPFSVGQSVAVRLTHATADYCDIDLGTFTPDCGCDEPNEVMFVFEAAPNPFVIKCDSPASHFTVEDETGTKYTQVSDNALILSVPGHAFKAYPSDSGGNKACEPITKFDLETTPFGDPLTLFYLDLTQATKLRHLRLYSDMGNMPLQSIVFTTLNELEYVQIFRSSLLAASVDDLVNELDDAIANGTCYIAGGPAEAPTAASLAKRTALAGNGWTLTFNP